MTALPLGVKARSCLGLRQPPLGLCSGFKALRVLLGRQGAFILFFFLWEDQEAVEDGVARAAGRCFCSSPVASQQLRLNRGGFFFLTGERIRFDIAVGSVAYDHVAPHQKVNPRRRGRRPEVKRPWRLWHAAGVTWACVAAKDRCGIRDKPPSFVLSLPPQ